MHCVLGGLVKGASVMSQEVLIECLSVSWQLLLEPSQQTASAAAALLILASVKAPHQAAHIMETALHHPDPAIRINAVLRSLIVFILSFDNIPQGQWSLNSEYLTSHITFLSNLIFNYLLYLIYLNKYFIYSYIYIIRFRFDLHKR
jgi:hypothetical protein